MANRGRGGVNQLSCYRKLQVTSLERALAAVERRGQGDKGPSSTRRGWVGQSTIQRSRAEEQNH